MLSWRGVVAGCGGVGCVCGVGMPLWLCLVGAATGVSLYFSAVLFTWAACVLVCARLAFRMACGGVCVLCALFRVGCFAACIVACLFDCLFVGCGVLSLVLLVCCHLCCLAAIVWVCV